MIINALLGLIQSILLYLIIYRVGGIIKNSEHLRNYLGLSSSNEDDSNNYSKTTLLMGQAGNVIRIYAVYSSLLSIYNTIYILNNL